MTSDLRGAGTKFTVSILYLTVYAYQIERISAEWGVGVELVEGVWLSCCGEYLSLKNYEVPGNGQKMILAMKM
jgi:hypothetical protein